MEQLQEKLGLLIEALKQPSTMKGILGLLAVFGAVIQPEKWEQIVGGVATIYFLVAIFWQKS